MPRAGVQHGLSARGVTLDHLLSYAELYGGDEREPDMPPPPGDGDDPRPRAKPSVGWQLPAPTLQEFLDEPEPEHDWLVPGLLERGDRVIVTSSEGGGKSTLLRQFGVQAAAGIHPFALDDIDPVKVVLLDLENSRRHVRRQLRPLRITAGSRLDPTRLVVSVASEGIDLLREEGRMALDDLLGRTIPDLFIVGPLYKLATGDPKDEEQAQAVRTVLDGHRAAYGCALLIEAHQPYATGGGRARPLRPYGASLWSRWPEFGIAITDRHELLHWRGARDERQWPAALKRGGEWPWTVQTDPRAVTFARILDATRDTGQRLSVRALAEAIGNGADRNQIQRAIDANRHEYDQFIAALDGADA